MRELLTVWNQYGFETDVFDKYRDAVKRSNCDSVKVLSCLSIATSLMMIAYTLVTQKPMAGLAICLAQLAAGIAGVIISFRKDSSRKALLIVGYVISAIVYVLAVYGAVILNTDAFWIGAEIAVGCYLLDYALPVGILQIASYFMLYLGWNASPDITVTGSRLLFSLLFLAVSLVTCYTMNRTRVSLIMGKEESRQAADTDLLTACPRRRRLRTT